MSINRWARVAVSTVLAMSLAGCAASSDSSLSRRYDDRNTHGYTTSDGAIIFYPKSERTTPLGWEAVDSTGTVMNSSALIGQVAVLNFWYAGCAPCRQEAPLLEKLHERLGSTGVVVLGVNTRDSAATAHQFEINHNIKYESLLDASDGAVVQAYAKTVPIRATPSTIILDEQGMVAASIFGQIPSERTVTQIVQDVESDR